MLSMRNADLALLDQLSMRVPRANGAVHLPRGIVGVTLPESYAEAREAADLRARSAVRWNRWLGGESHKLHKSHTAELLLSVRST